MKKNDNNKHSYIFTRETFGMTLLLFSALLLLILATNDMIFAALGQAVCTFMYGTFGYGSYLVIVGLVALGVWLVFGKKPKVRVRTVAMASVTLAVLFMLFHAVTTRNFAMDSFGSYLGQCYSAAEQGFSGYTFGGALSGLLVYPVARGTTFIGAYVIFSVLSAVCLYLTFLFVRGDIISRGGKARVVNFPRAAKRSEVGSQEQTVANDNAYTVDSGNQIVNNFHPVQQDQPVYTDDMSQQGYAPQDFDTNQNFAPQNNYFAPQQDYYAPQQEPAQPSNMTYASVFNQIAYGNGSSREDEDDKYSRKNLGRKIIFEKGEFAAESYRRNMIFDEDSYFNHPVKPPEENTGKSSSNGSVSSSNIAQQPQAQQVQPQQPPVQQSPVQQQQIQPAQSQAYPQSYSESYSEEVENRDQGPATPSYIYGDRPADSLDDYVPNGGAYDDDAYFGGSSSYDDVNYGNDYGVDDHSDYTQDDFSSFGNAAPENNFDTRRQEDFSGRRTEQPSRDRLNSDILGDFSRRSAELDGSSFGDTARRSTPELGNRSFGDTARRSTPEPDSRSFGDSNRRADKINSDEVADRTLSDRSMRVDRLGDRDTLRSDSDFLSTTSGKEEGDDVDDIFVRHSETPVSREPAMPDDGINSAADSFMAPSGKRDKPLLSRRDDSRENIFDGDDDDYLTEDVPDLGMRSLRSDGAHANGSRSDDMSSLRRNELPVVPDEKTDNVPAVPVRSSAKQKEQPAAPVQEKPKHVWKKYVRPTLDLLADYPENNNANVSEIEDNKKLIIETLENFRIAAHISDVIVGPAITRYDVIIEDRTNIKNAMRYREAIAMALMKENVTAYLNYSKGAISIEVPNGKRSIVGLKSMLKSNEFINCKPNTLTFALGKNVEGKPNCPDITKMPHLLVAGTTGSGKSICLSALIISLLYKYGPDELRFILVDPKQSEFISYENLPHLIVNEIISDVDKAIKALNWAIKEMERRYALFKEMTLAGTLVKNINEYNAHLPEGEEKLPKIVIILDEFGDLMLQNKKDIESRIIRLVQKSRACGIHLILATQRPSVDCITGLIKSNLPTRIGFKVNSFDDSRTIFDVGGAEKLLGAGDMYYRSAQNPDLTRIQGCFIDSPEVQAVTDFIKKNNETYFDQSISDFINTVEEPEGDGGSDDGSGDGDVKIDDKFIQALKFCVTSNQASVSMLQRRFPIGYVKACKIIDWMENMNYITQSEGSKPRKVLLSLDEFTRIYGDVDD